MTAAGIELVQPVSNSPAPAQGGAASLLPVQPAQERDGFLPVLNALLDPNEAASREVASARPENRPGGMLALRTATLADALNAHFGAAESNSVPYRVNLGDTKSNSNPAKEGVPARSPGSRIVAKQHFSASDLTGINALSRLDAASAMNSSPLGAVLPALFADSIPNLQQGSGQPVQLPNGPTVRANREVGAVLDRRLTPATGLPGDLAFALHLRWQPPGSSLAAQLTRTSSSQRSEESDLEHTPLDKAETESLPPAGAPNFFGDLGPRGSAGSTNQSQVRATGVSSYNLIPGGARATSALGTGRVELADRPSLNIPVSDGRRYVTTPASGSAAHNGHYMDDVERTQSQREEKTPETAPDKVPDIGPDAGANSAEDTNEAKRERSNGWAGTRADLSFDKAGSGEHSREMSPDSQTQTSVGLRSDKFHHDIRPGDRFWNDTSTREAVLRAPSTRITGANADDGPSAISERGTLQPGGEQNTEKKDRENSDLATGERNHAGADSATDHLRVGSERASEMHAAAQPAGLVTPAVRNTIAAAAPAHNAAEQPQAGGLASATKPAAMQPVRDISFHLATDASKVDIQVAERAGKIQVAVRTADSDLGKSLQSNLGDLLGRLQDQGFRTESWLPVNPGHVNTAGTTMPKEPSNFADGQGRGGQSHSDGQANGGGRHSQQDSGRQQQGRWKSQFDALLSPSHRSASGS